MFATRASTRRPWQELIKPTILFSCPKTFGEAARRSKYNLTYFRANYAIVVLFVLILSVWLHRRGIVFFAVFTLIWCVLYFAEEEVLQLEGWDQAIGCRVLLDSLLIFAIFALLYTGLWRNVLVSIFISFGLLGVHAAFRGLEASSVAQQDLELAATGTATSV